MRTRLFYALVVLVSGQLLQMGGCRLRPVVPAVERAAVSIQTVHHGAIPLRTKAHRMTVSAGSRPKPGVEYGQIENVNYMERGFFDQGNMEVNVFRVEPDGKTATQVPVRFGIIASELIEIKEGLREGDQVIVSDMSRWSYVDRIRIE